MEKLINTLKAIGGLLILAIVATVILLIWHWDVVFIKILATELILIFVILMLTSSAKTKKESTDNLNDERH